MHIDEILRPHRRCLSEAKRSAYQYFVHTADLSALIGIKLSLEERQEAGWSVGARVDDVGKGGPLWSPGGGGVIAFPLHVSTGNRTRATIKALPAAPHHPRPYGWR